MKTAHPEISGWMHTGKIDRDTGCKPRVCASKKRTIRTLKKRNRRIIDQILTEE